MAPPLLNFIRDTLLRGLKSCGVLELVKNSGWRQQRVLILCYHGIALEDEHQWRPYLFVSPQHFQKRLRMLRDGNYTVLGLAAALEMMYQGELPPRSAVLTFDDGTYDFYRHGYPQLKDYGYPATVYLTTYYSSRGYPVFKLICSYMLWKRRELRSVYLGDVGIHERVDLYTERARQQVVNELLAASDRQDLTGEKRNLIAAKLAAALGIDYAELCAKRILQIMNASEVKELARAGVDFQLHTHRHQTPAEESLFRREIRENREKIHACAGNQPAHFCYPSGAYKAEFLPWLSAERVISATTCDTGLADKASHPLLLPRLVDTSGRSELMFEGWLSGAGQFLSRKRRSGHVGSQKSD